MKPPSRQVWNWRDDSPDARRRRVSARLRRVGLSGGAVALIVGTVLNKVFGHELVGRVIVILGAVQALTALWRPLLLAGPVRWLARFGELVGRTLAWLLLSPLWLLVFVPGGVWLRLRGHDPLQRTPLAVGLTAWIPRRRAPDASAAERQFLDEDPGARRRPRPEGTLPEPTLMAEVDRPEGPAA